MGLTNHLIATVLSHEGEVEEIDIQFNYGEVREIYYRLGDTILAESATGLERLDDAVIPGIALVSENKSDSPIKLEVNNLRYFRIVVINGRIASFLLTSLEDYESLEAALERNSL